MAAYAKEMSGESMTPFAMYLDGMELECAEKRTVAAFTRRIVEIAALSRSTGVDLDWLFR